MGREENAVHVEYTLLTEYFAYTIHEGKNKDKQDEKILINPLSFLHYAERYTNTVLNTMLKLC